MVIALVLLERLAGPLEQSVGSLGGGGFERAEKLRGAHLRGKKEVDVIDHDHPRVQLIVSDFDAVLDGGQDQFRDGRLPEKGRAAPSVVEQAVHGDESFAAGHIRGGKETIRGKTAMQAEGYEEALAVPLYMWETAASQDHA
jgi:hypothetical protein